MTIAQRTVSARLVLTALATTLFLAACGGGSSGGATMDETPVATTGTFGLFITDKPSEDFDEINLDVIQAVLIGGDDSQQVLFDAGDGPARRINLLDLENFNEPIALGDVAVGTYTKLRLFIDNLVLVRYDTEDEPGETINIEKLPANGKIDLLDQDGFEILPGATLLAEVDIDANKSINVTGAGNSGKYKFRPVVKVQISSDGADQKLTRIEGFVSGLLDPAGSFALCASIEGDNCVDVMSGMDTSFFNAEGLFADFTGVTPGSEVTVFGRYQVDPDIFLDAIVVEIGGTAEQVKGQVVSNPDGSSFLLLAENESDLVVELQANTRYFDADGEIGANAVVLGAAVEVEGVLPDADSIRAALVFIEAPDGDQLSGTIDNDITDRTFDLKLGDDSIVSVTVLDGADILLVNETDSEVEIGTIDMLEKGQTVDVFGTSTETTSGMFEANEIIVDVPPAT